MVTTRARLRDIGFEGLGRFADLPATEVPSTQGVYAVLRCTQDPPELLPRDPVGAIRGDPSVSSETLATTGMNGSEVVYFAKATRLQRRLEEYRRHGLGGSARPWVSRRLCQLGGGAISARSPSAHTRIGRMVDGGSTTSLTNLAGWNSRRANRIRTQSRCEIPRDSRSPNEVKAVCHGHRARSIPGPMQA